MSNEIKPIAYFRATKGHGIVWGEDCCCVDPIYDLDDDYDEQTVFSLPVYSSDVVESLKNRIKELEKEDEISDGTIKLCSTILAKIAITLKGEPMELARHGYHDLPELVAVLHLENELNKVQMEEMLTAMRRAVLALAFAAESSAAMRDDYNALSAAIDKAVAANKVEKT